MKVFWGGQEVRTIGIEFFMVSQCFTGSCCRNTCKRKCLWYSVPPSIWTKTFGEGCWIGDRSIMALFMGSWALVLRLVEVTYVRITGNCQVSTDTMRAWDPLGFSIGERLIDWKRVSIQNGQRVDSLCVGGPMRSQEFLHTANSEHQKPIVFPPSILLDFHPLSDGAVHIHVLFLNAGETTCPHFSGWWWALGVFNMVKQSLQCCRWAVTRFRSSSFKALLKNAALEMGLMIEVTLICLGTFRFQAVQMDWEVFPRSVGPTLLVNYG